MADTAQSIFANAGSAGTPRGHCSPVMAGPPVKTQILQTMVEIVLKIANPTIPPKVRARRRRLLNVDSHKCINDILIKE